LGRQRGSEVSRRQMNFGACVVNVSDDRPPKLENGESTDDRQRLNGYQQQMIVANRQQRLSLRLS
jgi:hypothetical protein